MSRLLAVSAGLVILLGLATSQASEAALDEAFARSAAALEEGRLDAALDELERLADRGLVHPDTSYNRGLCYALRARGAGAQPGDLGRAAAAFEETLLHRPGDPDAADALDRVRRELARRRLRRDKTDTLVRESIDRALVASLHPNTWNGLAIASSVGLGAALLLVVRKGQKRVVGLVTLTISIVLLACFVPLSWLARRLETERRPAVVVVDEIVLEQPKDEPAAPAIPEGSLVEIGEDEGGDLVVRWGNHEGKVPRTAVRPLAR